MLMHENIIKIYFYLIRFIIINSMNFINKNHANLMLIFPYSILSLPNEVFVEQGQ